MLFVSWENTARLAGKPQAGLWEGIGFWWLEIWLLQRRSIPLNYTLFSMILRLFHSNQGRRDEQVPLVVILISVKLGDE